MALKIDTNQSATAFHINTGATVFPYAIDAQHAISAHPLEWSDVPWSRDAADAARKRLAENAEANGLPPPREPEPLSEEDQAAIDEHNKAVEAAAERLAAYRAKKAAENEEAAQVAADEAIVASLPPQPDPTIRRPFGRPGEPTPAELEQIKKREAKKADDERIKREKADADAIAAAANATIAK
ncbi:hypothetical protein [Bradyrhizobium lablabi]|uniref:Uncharacterized protein n=1 Tax=Bradyrhizobium lablabi TaxID=722472 RepID=A0A1H5JHL3_9BRAD|nr:hypothetical protein [Bradyrhizobium lablabi]SEE52035.1 hypothetical protein SAMN05444171_7833 [Bradyrhizobium lablabi]